MTGSSIGKHYVCLIHPYIPALIMLTANDVADSIKIYIYWM